MSSDEEMCGVYAGGRVAPMADDHAVGNDSVSPLPRNTMRSPVVRTNSHDAVTILILRTLPQPARLRLHDPRPEPFLRRAHPFHLETSRVFHRVLRPTLAR